MSIQPQSGISKHGGDRGSNQHKTWQKDNSRKVCANSYAEQTAKKVGQSTRSVQLDLTRGDRLKDHISKIAGTSLDKGTELDALPKVPEPHRERLIERAAAGETVSAVKWLNERNGHKQRDKPARNSAHKIIANLAENARELRKFPEYSEAAEKILNQVLDLLRNG